MTDPSGDMRASAGRSIHERFDAGEPGTCILRRLELEEVLAVDAMMRELQRRRIADEIDDTLIFVEHPETVTSGRRAARDRVVAPAGYRLVEVDRGGGLTWHGPGQLVIYPVFKWTRPGERSVKGAIDALEGWIIAALARFGLVGRRDSRMSGVWIGERKIASVGLSFQHWVTRHGCSINLQTPPNRVEGFAGCALEPGTTTSIAAAAGIRISRAEMENALLDAMPAAIGRRVADVAALNPSRSSP